MEEARLIPSLVDEISGIDLWAREAVLEYTVQMKRSTAIDRFLRCGGGSPDDSEGRGWRYSCENRWDPLCLHRRASKAYRLTPRAAKDCKYWVLATARLGRTQTISSETATQLEALAKRILRSRSLTESVEGSFWTMEVGFPEPDGATAIPHLHFLFALSDGFAQSRDAWTKVLDDLGLEASPESFQLLRGPRGRINAMHYLHKRWRNRPIPPNRLIETMAAFEGVKITRRTGIFREAKRTARNKRKN